MLWDHVPSKGDAPAPRVTTAAAGPPTSAGSRRALHEAVMCRLDSTSSPMLERNVPQWFATLCARTAWKEISRDCMCGGPRVTERTRGRCQRDVPAGMHCLGTDASPAGSVQSIPRAPLRGHTASEASSGYHTESIGVSSRVHGFGLAHCDRPTQPGQTYTPHSKLFTFTSSHCLVTGFSGDRHTQSTSQ